MLAEVPQVASGALLALVHNRHVLVAKSLWILRTSLIHSPSLRVRILTLSFIKPSLITQQQLTNVQPPRSPSPTITSLQSDSDGFVLVDAPKSKPTNLALLIDENLIQV